MRELLASRCQAHTEHKLNQDTLQCDPIHPFCPSLEAGSFSQDLTAGMNRGATENNGIERPPWYTKEWPKETFSGDPFATLILVDDSSAKNPPINRLPPEDCQYNSPGCTLEEMETSNHKSDWLQCASTRIRNLLYCFYLSMIFMCFSVYPPHHTMEH